MNNEKDIETAIAATGTSAPRITPNKIDGVIAAIEYWHPTDTTLTVCVLTLKNGTCVVGESACVSKDNYNEEIGKDIAFSNAREKVWALEGYLLKDKLTFGNERTAQVAHEVNRAYCAAAGDESQVAWNKALEWQKDDLLEAVVTHLEVELTPRESHEAWVKNKLATGWSWGIAKDADRKKHPCLVPYESLPLTQRIKDYLFCAVVKAMK